MPNGNKLKKQKRLGLILLFWLMGIMLPVAWLASQWPPISSVFTKLTEAEWVHITMHLLLFSVLSWVYCYLSPLKKGWHKLFLILTLTLFTGLLQESLQVAVQNRALGIGEIFDLGVDLTGGLIGYSLHHLTTKPHKW